MRVATHHIVAALAALVGLALAGCSAVQKEIPWDAGAEIVRASEVEWGPLNPARGDASPRAGMLWGDRAGSGASGFLVRFTEGFSSPPHIHNVTYRGVVIRGLVHNDDPDAQDMWMPAGSFWTQPAGESHITAANARENIAYIEIDDGPYLVQPREQAFDSGERAVNVDASNIVWLDDAELANVSAPGARVAHLWRDQESGGALIELPAGFRGTLRGGLRAVVIRGRVSHASGSGLEPGSYFGAEGVSAHEIECGPSVGCALYVRSTGDFELFAG